MLQGVLVRSLLSVLCLSGKTARGLRIEKSTEFRLDGRYVETLVLMLAADREGRGPQRRPEVCKSSFPTLSGGEVSTP